MGTLYSLAPALIGISIVLQAGLNRKLAGTFGFPAAILLNAVVLLICAVLFYFLSGSKADIDFKEFSWWYVLPGIFGLCIILVGPWSISRFGAVYTFSLIISAQLAASLLWDWSVEKSPISTLRLVGVIVTWIGVMLSVRG